MVFLDGDNRVLRQNPEHEGATTPASTGSSTWRDRRMEVSFKFTTAQPVSFAVVGAEFETADDRDQVMVDISGAGTLLHARGGVITSSQFEATIALGTWYRLALEIDGTTLRGYLDGTLVAQLEGVSGVRGGIAVTASQAGDVHYDDVMVTLF
jgi:pectate lyase